MRAFVINLERSATRREFMQDQLDKQGIPFEFIKAIDGTTLSDEYLAKICDFKELSKRPHLMRRGVYGCLLSHYSVYEKIVAEGLPYALIMEDDIIIQPGLKRILNEIESKIQLNEAILLFSQQNYMPTVLSKQHTDLLHDTYKLSYPMEPWAFGSAAGYVISQQAAQGMLDLVLPIRYAADSWGFFYDEKAIRSLRCVTPFLVKPAGFKSDIDYVTDNTFLSKSLSFIDKRRIFPFKQLLDYRRKRTLNKTVIYSFSNAPSPVVAALTTATT